ncbi:MAG: hypothetical protein U0670_08890 [Anaerolineae bacterium]
MSEKTSRAPKNAGTQKKSAAPARLDDLISTSPQPALTLSSPAAVLALQRTIGNRAVSKLIQRNRPEEFESFEEAKNATPSSRDLLDEQADDTLDEHIGKPFKAEEINAIYESNTSGYDDGEIHSESDGETLYLQDTGTTPHVDHRFPKARGGSNSFTNAAVIPASANISKSDKTELSAEPTKALPPYKNLDESNYTIGGFMNFNANQKKDIYTANKLYYSSSTKVKPGDRGKVISDDDGKTPLEGYDSSQVPHIDHITPKSDEGSSFYFNAAVLSAAENTSKGGVKGKRKERYDWLELQMTLEEYYTYKEDGTIPDRLLEDESDSEDEAPKKTSKKKKTKTKK